MNLPKTRLLSLRPLCHLAISFFLFVLCAVSPGRAHAAALTITPTFGSSITSDPNAAAIEATINSAIQVYENTYTNPINVSIYFQEGGGLGASTKDLYFSNYNSAGSPVDFRSALQAQYASSGNVNQGIAFASLPNTTINPVTGTSTMALSTADIKALGGPSLQGVQASNSQFYDGIISLNTSITTPGSPGSSLQYVLTPVVQHEINEILGLGSSLAQGFQSTPSAEDLYRYASAGVRSYTTTPTAHAFFSIDGGNTLLAQFDNQNDGGDWADWQSNPIPNGQPYRVQDAFGHPGTNPQLGAELTALNVIGYNTVPEPASVTLLALGIAFLACCHRRRFAPSRWLR